MGINEKEGRCSFLLHFVTCMEYLHSKEANTEAHSHFFLRTIFIILRNPTEKKIKCRQGVTDFAYTCLENMLVKRAWPNQSPLSTHLL